MHRTSERQGSPAQPPAEARAVDQQHDAPDALDRERKASARMRMPHERDQSAAGSVAKTPEQDRVIGQAAADLKHGLRDTDCRGQPPDPDSPCPPSPASARSRARTRSVGAAAPARLGRAGRRMRRAGTRAARP